MKKSPKKKKTKKKSNSKDLTKLAYPQHLAESHVVEELRKKVERLRIFDNIGKTLTSSLDLNEILRLIIEEFASLVGTRHLGLVLTEEDDKHFFFQYPESLHARKQSFRIGEGLVGSALESPKPSLHLKPYKNKNFFSEVDERVCQNPETLITVPVISKGRALGVLILASQKDERALTAEHLELVQSFNDYLAIAVENARHYERLQDLSITDDLTKLYNSRYLPVVLERELSRSKRYEEELSLVFLDIDNFKLVNDQYGHIAGSRLLTEFGDFLYEQIRSSDIGIRYGGDEFVLILPKTHKADAIRVVQRAIDILHETSFINENDLHIKMTASFGISTFPEDGESVDQIISSADRAMYKVKRGNKDGLDAGSLTAAEMISKSLKS